MLIGTGMKRNCKHSSGLCSGTFSTRHVGLLSWFLAGTGILAICSLFFFPFFPILSECSPLFTFVRLTRQVGILVCVVAVVLVVRLFFFLLLATGVWCNFVCYIVYCNIPIFFCFFLIIVVGLPRFFVRFVPIQVGDVTPLGNWYNYVLLFTVVLD